MAAPDTVDARTTAVAVRILQRNHACLVVARLGCSVTLTGIGVALVRGDVPQHGPVEDLVDLGVPLGAGAVPLLGGDVPPISRSITAISHGVALVRVPVPLVGCPLALAQPSLLLTH